MRLGDTPVPIPNTTVKTQEADGTALETVWESRWMPDPLKTGFTSDQRIEQKFSFLMTDKASVKSSAEAERTCTLKTAYTKNNPKNVKRLEIGKRDIRGVIF